MTPRIVSVTPIYACMCQSVVPRKRVRYELNELCHKPTLPGSLETPVAQRMLLKECTCNVAQAPRLLRATHRLKTEGTLSPTRNTPASKYIANHNDVETRGMIEAARLGRNASD